MSRRVQARMGAFWVLLFALPAQSQLPNGCVRMGDDCKCYTARGRAVAVEVDLCEAAIDGSPAFTLSGGTLREHVSPLPKQDQRISYAMQDKPPGLRQLNQAALRIQAQ